jgi:hypothetical protein
VAAAAWITIRRMFASALSSPWRPKRGSHRAGYLPFLEAGDESAVLSWFLLKPLLACLVAEQDGLVVGVAGLRDADPGPGAGMPGGRWLEACRLSVDGADRTDLLLLRRVSRLRGWGSAS